MSKISNRIGAALNIDISVEKLIFLEKERKRALIILLVTFGDLMLLGMAIFLFSQNEIFLGLGNIFVLLLLSFLEFIFLTKDYKYQYDFLLLIICLYFAYLFIIGSTGNSANLWSLCIPVFCFFLTDSKKGLVYSIGYAFVLLVMLFIVPMIGKFNINEYDFDHIVRFFAVYATITGVSFAAEWTRRAANSKTIRYQRELEETITELEETRAQLRELTINDPLTNLFNKRYLYDHTDFFFTVNPEKYSVSIFFDIDDFKKYNDYYGHIKGDTVLQDIANVITEKFDRTENVIARFGGEEIVALVKTKKIDDVVKCVQDTVDELNSICIPNYESKIGCVTLSIGVAVCKTEDYKGWEMLVKESDEAMYEAKKMGKNQYIMRVKS
jgi:diguanylate cyclase (GGDEF)-like protein